MKMEKIETFLIQSDEEVEAVLAYLEKAENKLVAFDIETNSADEHKARVIGIAVTCEADQGIYFPFAEWNGSELVPLLDPEYEREIVERLCSILLKKRLIMHNGVFDIVTMQQAYGIDLSPALFCDTILLKHTVDEERPFALKELGVIYFGEGANDEQLDLAESVKKAGGRWTKFQKDLYKGDLELIGKYACKDVALTLALYNKLSPVLKREGLEEFFYIQEVMPLYRDVTIPMKTQGVYVDVDYFKQLKSEIEADIIKLTKQVFDDLGDAIKPKVMEILDKNVKATKTGKFAQKVLEHYNLPVPLNKKTGKPTLVKKELQSLLVAYPGHVALEWLLHAPKIEEVEVEEEVWESEDGEELDVPIKVKVKQEIEVADPDAPTLPQDVLYEIKKLIYVERKPQYPEVFNLSSTQHLSWLLFDHFKQKPKNFSRTTGAAQVDKKSLEEYDLDFIPSLSELKKQEKLLNTYILPILEKQNNGILYPSMLQFGTTSGRYSCAGGLNLMTLPRDDKRIKKGFISPPGYKVVNADFSALEPRIFSWVSRDEGLKRIWLENLDLYSQIAIDVFGLEGMSADPKHPDYLKEKAPDWRNKAKVFTLAVVYGANAYRIAEIMKVDPKEAQDIIDRYLNAYPGLQEYMKSMEEQAFSLGMVYTDFGRVRHLKEAKDLFQEFGDVIFRKMDMAIEFLPREHRDLVFEYNSIKKQRNKAALERAKELKNEIYRLGGEGVELYYRFRNYLNNAKNFPIQATAAHVANASLIMLAELFDAHEIDGWICLQIHDEITCIVRNDQAELAAQLLKRSMEQNPIAQNIDIPMIAEPMIADNFAEAK